MIKLRQQWLGILVLAVMILNGMVGSAYGLDSGSYVVTNITHYVNPDTGDADDGGDTSTGEGMCRNTTYSDCLYEFKDGKHYVTLRIKLISYIKNFRFAVQEFKGNSKAYKEAGYTLVGENLKENTRDFRIELPAENVLIKPTFFVGPMNRDVTYFVGLDMNTARQDVGSFAAFNIAGNSNESESDPPPTDVTAGNSAVKSYDTADSAAKAREENKPEKKAELKTEAVSQAVTGTPEQVNSKQESTPAAGKSKTENKDTKASGIMVTILCAVVVTGAYWLYRKKSKP